MTARERFREWFLLPTLENDNLFSKSLYIKTKLVLGMVQKEVLIPPLKVVHDYVFMRIASNDTMKKRSKQLSSKNFSKSFLQNLSSIRTFCLLQLLYSQLSN